MKHFSGDRLDVDQRGPFLVLGGWAAEQQTIGGGRQQLVRLAIPGEFCSLGARSAEHGWETIALTDLTVADVGQLHLRVRERRADPTLLAAWRRLENLQHMGDLRQILRLGSLSAVERAGHLLLELYERSVFPGLTGARAMSLPLTQLQLASYLGLSPVHANRVLLQLRHEGLIEAPPHMIIFPRLSELANRCFYELGCYARAAAPVMATSARGAPRPHAPAAG